MTEPSFQVVRGQPTDEETAALAVVLAALAARERAGPVRAGGAGTWASHARALRARPAQGPGAWRRSALPG